MSSLQTASTASIAFPPNWPARIGAVIFALYVIYASSILVISWARISAGIGHGTRFIERMFPPNVAPDKLELLTSGMIESLQIAIIATVVGVATVNRRAVEISKSVDNHAVVGKPTIWLPGEWMNDALSPLPAGDGS